MITYVNEYSQPFWLNVKEALSLAGQCFSLAFPYRLEVWFNKFPY